MNIIRRHAPRTPITVVELLECGQILAWALIWAFLGAGSALLIHDGRSTTSFTLFALSLTMNGIWRLLRRVTGNSRWEHLR